jgi:hypothetical protein
MKMVFGLWNALVFLAVLAKGKPEKRLSKILGMQLLNVFKFGRNLDYP